MALEEKAILGDSSQAEFIQISPCEVLARTPLPGHTSDSHAYLLGPLSKDSRLRPQDIRFAFTGDTLLIGGIGRTDFPTSSIVSLYDSLQRLPQIIGRYTPICPTHDYESDFATTLGTEIKGSAFLASVVDSLSPIPIQEFERLKKELDSQIEDEKNPELVCGLISNLNRSESSIDIAAGETESFFASHRDSRIIDVREPHEFRFSQDWSHVGLENPPENIPLTRLTNFFQQLLNEPERLEQNFIFICRSGNRSGVAAKALRRIGVPNSWHISGGLALGRRPNGVSEDSDRYDFMI